MQGLIYPLAMSPYTGSPMVEIGDVVIHHMAPRVWYLTPITKPADIDGHATHPYRTRPDAIEAARALLQHGRRIYIHHRDDALWEEVLT